MYEVELQVRAADGSWEVMRTEHEDPDNIADVVDEFMEEGELLGTEFRIIIHFQI